MPANIEWERRRHRVEQALGQIAGLDAVRRNTFEALLTDGRHCHVMVAASGAAGARADAFVLRRTGIYALTFADALDDRLLQGIRDQANEVCEAVAMGRNRFVPSAIQIVQVLPVGRVGHDERVRATTPKDVVAALSETAQRYSADRVDDWADAIARRLSGYVHVAAPPQSVPPRRGADADDGLFTADDVRSQRRDHALALDWQQWMHFLDDEQRAYVRKNYTGPARIGGPAGTGKSVIAMHRLARIARESHGKLLFTTLVGSLVNCQRAAFRTLAPEVADRVEFTTLHKWARSHLADSEVVDFERYSLDANTAFWQTWREAGGDQGPLARKVADPLYWRDEITQVIEGRGIRTEAEYVGLRRVRDRLTLTDELRHDVWTLYQAYLAYKSQHNVLDFSDLLRVALEAVRENPIEPRYRMVVVDEVQDIPLIGVRLAAELADATQPNSLLLVGDGQQQVYSAGWRMSELGWEWRGRSEILRVNYRNRRKIHDYARTIGAANALDDTRETPPIPLRDTSAALDGGVVEHWHGPESQLVAALVEALRSRPTPRPPTAVIVDNNGQIGRLVPLLRRANLAAVELEKYDCSPSERIVVGTVYMAKGLDFAEIFRIVEAKTQGITPYESDRRDRQRIVAATRARDHLWVGVVDDEPNP
jgi:hypothetical protein